MALEIVRRIVAGKWTTDVADAADAGSEPLPMPPTGQANQLVKVNDDATGYNTEYGLALFEVLENNPDANGWEITGLGAPQAAASAATKGYVDALEGLGGHIATLTPTGTVATFAGIPATYKHLLVTGTIRTARAVVIDDLNAMFNNAGAGSYYSQWLSGSAAAASAVEILGASDLARPARVPGASADANRAGLMTMWILDYQSAFHKMWTSDAVLATGTGTGTLRRDAFGGVWANTAAITRLDFLPSAGASFAAGTTISVYGIG